MCPALNTPAKVATSFFIIAIINYGIKVLYNFTRDALGALLSRRYTFEDTRCMYSERWYCRITRVLRIMLHKRVHSACGRMQPGSVSRQHKFYDRAAQPGKLLGLWWANPDSWNWVITLRRSDSRSLIMNTYLRYYKSPRLPFLTRFNFDEKRSRRSFDKFIRSFY